MTKNALTWLIIQIQKAKFRTVVVSKQPKNYQNKNIRVVGDVLDKNIKAKTQHKVKKNSTLYGFCTSEILLQHSEI